MKLFKFDKIYDFYFHLQCLILKTTKGGERRCEKFTWTGDVIPGLNC